MTNIRSLCPNDMKCVDILCRRKHSTHSGISPLAVCKQKEACFNPMCIFYHPETKTGTSPAAINKCNDKSCFFKFCKNKLCDKLHNTPDTLPHITWCEEGKFGTKCENKSCILKHIKIDKPKILPPLTKPSDDITIRLLKFAQIISSSG